MIDGMIVLTCNSVSKEQGQAPHTNTYGYFAQRFSNYCRQWELWWFSKTFRLFFYRSNPTKHCVLSLARPTIPHPEREWRCVTAMCSLCPALQQAPHKGMLVLISTPAKDSLWKAKIQLKETQFLEHFKVEELNWTDGESWNCNEEGETRFAVVDWVM